MLGLAAALALATKGTAYLFVPPLLRLRRLRPAAAASRLWIPAAVCRHQRTRSTCAISQLSAARRSAYDSAQGDGVFRWRNEHLTWKPAVSE